jgi:hypothetical protein
LVRVSRRVGNLALTHLKGEHVTVRPRTHPTSLYSKANQKLQDQNPQLKELKVASPATRPTSTADVSYRAPYDGDEPHRCLSTSRDVRFTLDGFHALLAPQARCFSAFPYGTCLLSVTTLSYLALDGQHHPYSASTFKLAYSRATPLPSQPTRSRVTPCAPGSQPVCCKPCASRVRPLDYRSQVRRGQWDSVSGLSLFARSY